MTTLTQYKLNKHRINQDITLKPEQRDFQHYANWQNYVNDSVAASRYKQNVIEQPYRIDRNDPNFDKPISQLNKIF